MTPRATRPILPPVTPRTPTLSCVGRALLAVALAASAAACGADAPERTTLRAVGGTDEGLRLADGAVIADAGGAGATEADLVFHQAMVMSLRSPTPASICPRGEAATLGDIADAGEDCAGEPAGWAQFVYLDASTTHTLEESNARGLALVVLDRDHQLRYRVRVVGDAYGEDGASVVLEYEPAP